MTLSYKHVSSFNRLISIMSAFRKRCQIFIRRNINKSINVVQLLFSERTNVYIITPTKLQVQLFMV